MKRKILLLTMVMAMVSVFNTLKSQNINVAELLKRTGSGTNGRVINDGFGTFVAVSGNIAVVGAPYQDYDSTGLDSMANAGAIYIYYRANSCSENWNFVKKVTPSGTNGRVANDNFGFSVAVDGDIIVAGARNQSYDSAGGNFVTAAGAAYVFYKNSGGTDNWGLVKKVTGKGTNGRNGNDNFGNAVAISGDVIVIGAFNQDYDDIGSSSNTNTGAIYIFNKNSGGTNNWGIVAKRTNEVPPLINSLQNSSRLGRSVAIEGDVIVAGSAGYGKDSTVSGTTAANCGGAFIYYRNNGGTDNWGFHKILVGKGTNGRIAGDAFGKSVGISGDVIVVGADLQDYDSAGNNSATDAGAAYIFNKNSGGADNWGFMKKLSGAATNGRNAGDNFGYTVGIYKDTIIVGARYQFYDTAGGNSLTNAGAAYIYYRQSGGTDNWGLLQRITSGGTNGRVADDNFASSVAISSDNILIGAPNQDYDSLGANSITDGGAVYFGKFKKGLIYNGSTWWPYAPSATTTDNYAYIQSGSPAFAAGVQVKHLSISSGASATISSGAVTLLCNCSNNGTITGSGNITLGGSYAQTMGGSGAIQNLILNNAAGASISSSSGDSLIIKGIYTHTLGALTTNGKLKLKATDSTTYGQIAGTGTGTISGNVIAEYQVLGGGDGGWRPISSPLNGATIAQLADDLPLNYGTPNWQYATVYTFDESSSSPHWTVPLSTTSMDDTCFSIYIGKDSTWGVPAYLDITGTYRGTSDYTRNNLTKTGLVNDTSGWHYMRNPWPSAFVWDGTISNVQGNQVYLYDQNGGSGGFYRVYDNTQQGAIPPFAALLFQVTANNVSVTLPNSKRNTDSLKNVFDKTFPLDNYVELAIQKEGQPITDYVKFYTDDAAQNSFDAQDGIKKMNDPTMPSMYFTDGIDKLNKHAYNTIPMGTTKLPMLFATTTNGKYILNPRIENLDADVEVFIEDLNTGKHEMYPVNNTPIEINYNGGGVANRYYMVFVRKATNTSVQTATGAAINMAQSDKTLFINGNLPANTQITVTDILGRVMMQQTVQDATNGITQYNLQQLATGYYIVNLSGETIHHTQKIVVK